MKNKKLFLLILIFNILFFVVAAWLLPFQYEENDDIAMCAIANGSFSGLPDCHLVFINAIYGSLLVLLYKLFGVVEWYTISFSILHIVSMTVISYTILNEKRVKGIIKGVFLIFFYVIWIRIMLAFQFTTTAGLTCLAGCVLLSRKTKSGYIFGLVLVVIASMVRFSAAALVALVYIPVFLYENGLKVKSYIPLVFVLFFVLLFKALDSFFYKTEGWKEYRQFNEIRGRINDNPNAYNLDIAKLPQGIDKDEFVLLLYFIPDPNILTLDAMKQLDQVIQKTSFADKVENVKGSRKYFMVILVLTGGFAATILTKDKKKVLFGMASWLLGLTALFIIAMDGMVKYRVFICYLIPMMWIFYWLVKDVEKFDVITALILVPSLLISLKYSIHNVKIRESNKSYVSEEFIGLQCSLLEDCQRNNGDADYRICGWNFSDACLNPMKIKDANIKSMGCGWMTNMPFDNSLKSHLDFLNDDVAIFTSKDENGDYLIKLNKIQDCIYRNYGVSTKTEVICENDKYEMVQIIVDNEADEEK